MLLSVRRLAVLARDRDAVPRAIGHGLAVLFTHCCCWGDETVGVENDATVLPGFYHFMQTTRAGGRDSRRSCRAVVGDFPESDSEKLGEHRMQC